MVPQIRTSAARLPPVAYPHTSVLLGAGSKSREFYVYVWA